MAFSENFTDALGQEIRADWLTRPRIERICLQWAAVWRVLDNWNCREAVCNVFSSTSCIFIFIRYSWFNYKVFRASISSVCLLITCWRAVQVVPTYLITSFSLMRLIFSWICLWIKKFFWNSALTIPKGEYPLTSSLIKDERVMRLEEWRCHWWLLRKRRWNGNDTRHVAHSFMSRNWDAE